MNRGGGTHVRLEQTYSGLRVLGGEAIVHFDAAAFGIYSPNTDFRIMRTETDSIGTHVRLEQTYAGLPVLGGEAIVQLDPAGNVSSITSSIMVNTASLDDGTAPLDPVVTAAAADGAARLAMDATLQNRVAEEVAALTPAGAARGAMTTETASAVDVLSNATLHARSAPELMIYDPRLLGGEGAPRAVWALDVESDPSDLVNERVFVDAETGETQLTYSLTHFLVNRQIWNANQYGTTAAPPAVLARTESQPPTGNADVDNNHYIMGKAYDYFRNNHGWISFDNVDSPIRSYVRWNATPISGWNSTGEYFYFGSNNYAQADDVVGHEYTHAVTAHRCGLNSFGEAGAINEAFSDIWGEFIDWSNGGDSGVNRWQIGEDLVGGAIRDMANPAAHNQPSTMDSELFYHGADLAQFAAVNSGVCNKLFQLLTVGTEGVTFNDCTVEGLGDVNVRNLLWRCQTAGLTSSANFQGLYTALDQAAIDLGFTDPQRTDIVSACRAVGITADLETPPSTIEKGLGSWTGVRTWRKGITVTSADSFHNGKYIPYKVYVPAENMNVGGTPGRGFAQWPLDVIIFSHGAGMNRNIAAGCSASSVDGLAMAWAKKGYIVVCPTYRKWKGYWWEWPFEQDNFFKFLSDLIHDTDTNRSAMFHANRVFDLKYVRDHLDSILNVEGAAGCFGSTSRVGLAGHSLGAVTTSLAAGVKMVSGAGTPIILETANFSATVPGMRRQTQPVTTDWHYDSGPFVPADAYMCISAGTSVGLGSDTGAGTLTIVDPTLPNLNGQDLMQKPYMLLSGTNDMIRNTVGDLYVLNPGTTPVYHDSVLKSFGVCPSPAYAVIMDGANHVTPVSSFGAVPSRDIHVGWTWLGQFAGLRTAFINSLEASATDKSLASNDTWIHPIENFFNVFFRDYGSVQNDEDGRLGQFRNYTLAFWDVHLSPRYNITTDPALGANFLNVSQDDQQLRDWVNRDNGFRYSPPTCAFSVRNASGTPQVQFQSNGNVLVLQGNAQNKVHKLQTSLVDNTAVKELLMKNAAGTVVAKVDSSTGELSVRGNITVQQTTLAPTSAAELVINNSAGVAQIILDSSGNLKTRNKIYVVGGTYTP